MTPNERMERAQWDTYWLPDDARVIDRPELLYAACPRPLFHLNQVFRTRPPRDRWPALVEEVTAAHAHSQSIWQLFDTVDMSALERPLADAGYQRLVDSRTMVIDVNDFRAQTRPAITVRRVTDTAGLRHSLTTMETVFKSPTEHSDDELLALLAQSVGPDARTVRMVAYDRAEQPISTGSMNLYPALNLAYLWGGSTLPEARGQGAYGALLAARIALASKLGIGLIGVYAIVDTSAPILAARGFRDCGAMEKWRRPPPAG